MDIFRELRELWGNQKREEEEGVISVEPIAMVVPSALQDLLESITLESSASSSTIGRSGDRHSPSFKSSSSKVTPSDGEGARTGLGSPSATNIEESAPVVEEWENKTIGGKLDNIRKAPQSLPVGFRFRAALLHEVTDGAATIKGFKKLGEMNQLLAYVKKEGLVDLESLVTLKQLGVFGFVDIANLYSEARPIENKVLARCQDPMLSRKLKPCLWIPKSPIQPTVACSSNVLASLARNDTETGSASTSAFASSPRIAYLEDRQHAKGYIQQNDGHVAMLKLMDARELTESYKWLTTEKASLEDELEKALAEKESGVQATKDEAGLAKECAKRAEFKRDNALNELSSLRQRVAMGNQNLVHIEKALNKTKRVLRHRLDFLIGELAFFEVEEIDEQGKSLASLADTTVRLKWELNEDGVPIWPPSILEESEDLEGLPSFDAWVAEVPKIEAEPSSTPPTS
ncbi:hypothetical protein SLEP1_g23054 [Rubroshorea leprosula]|uniref:Uncharacterized protein n=1 Tax=Rubroshorea leprosula TaxID=152421 RepID=A0AAV5JM32_9ROSI|nr:hypothetical protein SLEP1_g23054 [Rubroshorea leprosula]